MIHPQGKFVRLGQDTTSLRYLHVKKMSWLVTKAFQLKRSILWASSKVLITNWPH